jgi:hypothetical protein
MIYVNILKAIEYKKGFNSLTHIHNKKIFKEHNFEIRKF